MRVITSLLFVAWLYLSMAIMGLLFLPFLVLPRSATMFGIRVFTRVVMVGLRLICGIRTEIRGREHMPEGPVIYAGKHQCMYDIFIPFLVLRDPAIIMKKELLWYPFLGWYALKSEMIPIDRAGTTKTLKAMVVEVKKRAANYRQIVIFPEGTRGDVGQPGDYKPGIAALYRELDMPVTPLALNCGSHWDKSLLLKPGTIVFQYLEPIPAGLKRAEFMRELQTRIDGATQALETEGL